jgi:hypothetical protein
MKHCILCGCCVFAVFCCVCARVALWHFAIYTLINIRIQLSSEIRGDVIYMLLASSVCASKLIPCCYASALAIAFTAFFRNIRSGPRSARR